jgi:hypothetical protein
VAYERPVTGTCAHCKRTFQIGPVGRVPTYCSPSCRTAACEAKRGPKSPIEDRIARRIWQALADANLVPADRPLPPRRAEDVTREKR